MRALGALALLVSLGGCVTDDGRTYDLRAHMRDAAAVLRTIQPPAAPVPSPLHQPTNVMCRNYAGTVMCNSY